MKIKVIVDILVFVSCPRYEMVIPMGIKVSQQKVPMPCDENIKNNLLYSLKGYR